MYATLFDYRLSSPHSHAFGFRRNTHFLPGLFRPQRVYDYMNLNDYTYHIRIVLVLWYFHRNYYDSHHVDK